MTLAYARSLNLNFRDVTAEENGGEHEELRPLQHDDDVGEDVPFEQTQIICESIIRQVTPPFATCLEVQKWVHVRTRASSGPTVFGAGTASELPLQVQPSSAFH